MRRSFIEYYAQSRYADNEARTLEAIERLSQIFVAACAWMGQEIVTSEEQPIQRTRRRQLTREARLTREPTVRVIALRRKHREERERAEGLPEDQRRAWKHQWVVSGHWRHQACGPGRAHRRLIFINPFIKGPEDKPLSEPKRKVFAVVR
jgi:hypothetical protein